MSTNKVSTFSELYEFLCGLSSREEFISYLTAEGEPDNESGYRQEGIFRMFAIFGLLPSLANYKPAYGNFNKCIRPSTGLRELFVTEHGKCENIRGNGGDASDYTAYDINDKTTILATTSKSHKNAKTETVHSLELDKIMNKFKQQQFSGCKLKLCIVIRDHKIFDNMKPQKGNIDVKPYLKKAICIDWTDLTTAFGVFKDVYTDMTFDSVIDDIPLVPHVARFYQSYASTKLLTIMQTAAVAVASALLAFLPRTGKTNVMTDLIIKHYRTMSSTDTAKYLIISPCPNETILQYFATLRCAQLRDFKVHHICGENLHPIPSSRDIYITSKQFLQGRMEEGKLMDWLQYEQIRIVFIDEAHFGCTTDLSKAILNLYAANAFRVFITATYAKPANAFNIPSSNVITWDMEDIMLSKNIDNAECKDRLIHKHGNEIIANCTHATITTDIGNFPELCYLTHEIKSDTYNALKLATQNNGYGWSNDAIFAGNWNMRNLKTNEDPVFQNNEAVLHEMYTIFGKKDEFGIPDPKYPDSIVFMDIIQRICKQTNQIVPGTSTDSPTVIVMFLPPNNVNNISNALKTLLEKDNVVDNYLILITNTTESHEAAKSRVDDAIISAKNMQKSGVLVLTGIQLHLGITIEMCDVVILMNNSQGFDKVFQMIFRSMTPRKGKTNGFVIDLNLQRALTTTIAQYANIVRPTLSTKDAISYLLESKLIKLNCHHWEPTFGNAEDALIHMAEHVYTSYIHNSRFTIDNKIKNLSCNQVTLTVDETNLMQNINATDGNRVQQLTRNSVDMNDSGQTLPTGLVKTRIITEATEEEEEVAEPEPKPESELQFIHGLMIHILPFMCILTILDRCNTSSGMLDFIYANDTLVTIFINQINKWWGSNANNKNNITRNQVKQIISIYNKYNMNETNDEIVANIKQMFLDSKHSGTELSKLVDVYFQPQDFERSKLAEISTPPVHRTNMLDEVDSSFWTNLTNTVIEPCAGKGQLLLDIYQRFCAGLETAIPNEADRHRHIVENCIYFADISETNIFICKLLLDPDNNCNVNSYVGDTLTMDMASVWGRTRFNLTVANPPYNEDPEASADPHKKPLYQDWIKYFNTITDQIVFITPSKWFTSDEKVLAQLREYMKVQSVIHIQHFPNDNEFPGVSIKGGVSYFHIDNRVERTPDFVTSFNGVDTSLSSFDDIIISSPTMIPLYLDMKQYISEESCLSSIYTPQGRYVTNENVLSKTKQNDDDIPCYVSQPKGFVNYCPVNSINKNKLGQSPDINLWKVVTTAAAHSGTSGFANIFIGKPGTIHSKSYISFNVASEEEATYLESYLKCKLPQVMLSLRKITHNITNKNVLSWIPIPPLDRIWTNRELFEHYGLSVDLQTLLIELKLDGNYSDVF